jgi:hypothetical protein
MEAAHPFKQHQDRWKPLFLFALTKNKRNSEAGQHSRPAQHTKTKQCIFGIVRVPSCLGNISSLTVMQGFQNSARMASVYKHAAAVPIGSPGAQTQ